MKLLKKYFQSLVRTVFCGESVSKEIKNTENALKALIFLLISNGSTMYNYVFFVNIEQNVKIQGTKALFNPEQRYTWIRNLF